MKKKIDKSNCSYIWKSLRSKMDIVVSKIMLQYYKYSLKEDTERKSHDPKKEIV